MFLLVFEARFARLNPSHYSAKKRLLEQQAARVEVLVLGNSQPFVGIQPALLGRPAFNLAANSQSLYYDLALLRKYRSALPALKLVILPIAYLTLESELDEGPDRWRAYYYRYFYSLPHRDWHMVWSARNYSAWFLCGSEISRASVLFGTCADALHEYDSWGGWTNRPCGELLPAKPDTSQLDRAALLSLRRHPPS